MRTNKRHNRKIKKCRCPDCGARLEVCTHGAYWWIRCTNSIPCFIDDCMSRSAEETISLANELYRRDV